MADRYRTFAELATNERFGIDYRIRVKDLGTPFVILAPHGGWIEPHTSEIAEAIAGTDLSFYAFEALKSGPHGDLHVTSHRFDEPKAINLVGRSRTAVAIHGRRNEGTEAVWLGGRATAHAMRSALACAPQVSTPSQIRGFLGPTERTSAIGRSLARELNSNFHHHCAAGWPARLNHCRPFAKPFGKRSCLWRLLEQMTAFGSDATALNGGVWAQS
nr:poly-gamma-glutamate hydrolase family protein [Mesorhizobium sp.]